MTNGTSHLLIGGGQGVFSGGGGGEGQEKYCCVRGVTTLKIRI